MFSQLLTPITSVNHKIRRIQHYTDTHYGDDLVVFNEAQLNDLEKLNGQQCVDPVVAIYKQQNVTEANERKDNRM